MAIKENMWRYISLKTNTLYKNYISLDENVLVIALSNLYK